MEEDVEEGRGSEDYPGGKTRLGRKREEQERYKYKEEQEEYQEPHSTLALFSSPFLDFPTVEVSEESMERSRTKDYLGGRRRVRRKLEEEEEERKKCNWRRQSVCWLSCPPGMKLCQVRHLMLFIIMLYLGGSEAWQTFMWYLISFILPV